MLFNAPLITHGVVKDSSEGNTFYLIVHDAYAVWTLP